MRKLERLMRVNEFPPHPSCGILNPRELPDSSRKTSTTFSFPVAAAIATDKAHYQSGALSCILLPPK